MRCIARRLPSTCVPGRAQEVSEVSAFVASRCQRVRAAGCSKGSIWVDRGCGIGPAGILVAVRDGEGEREHDRKGDDPGQPSRRAFREGAQPVVWVMLTLRLPCSQEGRSDPPNAPSAHSTLEYGELQLFRCGAMGVMSPECCRPQQAQPSRPTTAPPPASTAPTSVQGPPLASTTTPTHGGVSVGHARRPDRLAGRLQTAGEKRPCF